MGTAGDMGASLMNVHTLTSSNHFIWIELIKTDNLILVKAAHAHIYHNRNPNVHQSPAENSD